MLSLFQQYLLKKNIISPNQTVLCAISGGLDSMVMVDLLLKSNVEIGIAHINHNTRGEESDGDHQFVKGYAKSQGIAFFDLTLDPEVKNRSDFQQTARDLRYAFLNEITEINNYDLIATAHHSDDDVETFFINLLRGSGLNGLSGIPLKMNNVVRPLKFATRKMIEEYASQNQLAYREDSSNLSDKYLRNDIRHNIIPVLENIKPTASESIKRSISNISSAESVLKSLVIEKYVDNKNGQVHIHKSIPKAEDGITVLYTILSEYGFNRHQLQDIITSERIGSVIQNNEWKLINDREYYILQNDVDDMPINETINSFGAYTLADGRVLTIIASTARTAYWFDANPFPIVVRSRIPGDKFNPSGMKGRSKSIKKYLTDIKIASNQKANILLIEKNQTIFGVIGHRASIETAYDGEKMFGFEIYVLEKSD